MTLYKLIHRSDESWGFSYASLVEVIEGNPILVQLRKANQSIKFPHLLNRINEEITDYETT